MASQFDDLLSGVVNKLKGLGIGTKSPEQIERERDPVLKAQFERRMPTYDEIMESRRLRGQTRQPSIYSQQPIDDRTPSNIQAQEGQGTVGPAEYYDFNTRTDYSYEAPEYSKTMNFGTGLLSGKGLGLAAPATSYSAPVSSSGGSTGRGMYGMGTTPKGPVDAAEINPVFSKSDMDAIIAAGGRPIDDSYGVFTTTDAETGKEVIVDSYGRAHFVPPASQTRPKFETERGSLNLPGMFGYLFGSDGRGAVLDDGTALITGDPYARDLEGTPFSYIAEGIGGMLSDMAERANPGDVRDQTVRARRADNARDIAEEKIRIEQMMMKEAEDQGLTPREAQQRVSSQLGQRRVEEEQARRKQQREEALDQAAAEGYTQEEADLEVQRLLNRFPAPEEDKKDSLMDLIVSPVYGSDVIEDAPVQYDEMGSVISPTEVINTSQARAFDPQSVRNVRNNNPGNIKINKANDWKGRVSNLSDKTFESFQTPEYGVRALNKVVDANIKATNTFDEFVNRYASEPKEKEYFKKNGKLMPHLQNYADALARSQGLSDSSSKFPKNIDKKAWLRAIIRHEGGQEALSYYTDDVLSQGIKLK
jgi:hypothetical protein